MTTASVKEALACGQCLSPCQLLGQGIGIWEMLGLSLHWHERESIATRWFSMNSEQWKIYSKDGRQLINRSINFMALRGSKNLAASLWDFLKPMNSLW